jgi:HlyD family secretion protein
MQQTFHRHIMAPGFASALLVFGLGGWAATTEFVGAVIAQGQIVVDSNVKKVQYPNGGIVGELRVREGNRVKAGDIVVRLDDTQTRANLAIVIKALDELTARQAREEAERDGADILEFSPDLLDRMDDPNVAKAVNGERKQFEVRRQAREGQKSQLRERITQLKEETTGYSAQIASKDKQIEWIRKELVGVNDLWAKGLCNSLRSRRSSGTRSDSRANAASWLRRSPRSRAR